MPVKLLSGPLLGLEDDTSYTVSILSAKDTPDPEVVVDGRPFSAERIQETPNGVFWRAQVEVGTESAGRFRHYQIRSAGEAVQDPRNRSEWQFWVPGETEEPRIAYASCNGFSDGNAKAKLDDPYAMWNRMVEDHGREPFALLIMGGDQLYADEIWHSRRRAPSVAAWSRLGRAERIKKRADARLQRELDSFYESLYVRHWNQPEMSLMMASIPSLMMWDDHDIFDGWGSYPHDLQTCEVYQAIFAAARRYFELFQIRSNRNTSLLNSSGEHYSFGVRFRRYGVLGLDNRSNRTEKIVMSDQNWADVKRWLSEASGNVDTLLVLSAVPVVYREFSIGEWAFDITPWQEELTDDIRDQWRSHYHEGERMKLIVHLLSFGARTGSETVKRVILSGDVHVGCLGVVHDRRDDTQEHRIYQVVSSGIVHPAPSWLQWLGILAGSSEGLESLDGGRITTELIEPYGSRKFLRTRNYASLKEGTDKKLWVTWACENGRRPEYPIEGSG